MPRCSLVVVDRYLVERRDDIQEGKYPSAAQLVEDFIDAGFGKLTENADVELLAVDRKPNPVGFLWYDDHRARVPRRGVLLRPAVRYSSRIVSICLATRSFTR